MNCAFFKSICYGQIWVEIILQFYTNFDKIFQKMFSKSKNFSESLKISGGSILLIKFKYCEKNSENSVKLNFGRNKYVHI